MEAIIESFGATVSSRGVVTFKADAQENVMNALRAAGWYINMAQAKASFVYQHPTTGSAWTLVRFLQVP